MFSGQQSIHLGTQTQVVLEIEYKLVQSTVMRKFAKKTLSHFHYNQQTNENICQKNPGGTSKVQGHPTEWKCATRLKGYYINALLIYLFYNALLINALKVIILMHLEPDLLEQLQSNGTS